MIKSVFITILFFLAIVTLFHTERILLWKLTILGTEYGHWFALLSLLMFIYSLMKWSGGIVAGVQVAALLIMTLIFFKPTAQALWLQGKWSSDLQSTFKISPSRPLFSFSELWWGKMPKVAAQRHVYSPDPSFPLYFDFYPAVSDQPAPWVLVLHGGGWTNGVPSLLPELNHVLASQGVAVAAISYRLAPAAKWPAQKEDALKAAAYIKTHAKELNVDPKRWVILGRSAGGHIAEALAFQTKDPSLKGLVAFYTPADLNFSFTYTKENDIINSRDLLRDLLGGDPSQVPDLYNEASPIEYVSPSSPPTLLIHGGKDSLTWVKQSRRLKERMEKVGARCVYIELPWATHAFDFNLRGPGGQVASRASQEFLSAVFK